MNKEHSTHCIVCSGELSGLKRRFCSQPCKGKYGNNTFQSYAAQQARALDRKTQLVKLLGGECSRCHYSKNLAALCFHHIDPSVKEGKLDSRKLSNSTWESILKEAKKCILLCSNCHMETHYPNMQFMP